MRTCTSWLAVIVVAVTGFSASADIVVPEGFVVDILLDQIDGSTPLLEAIRNPDYGFGVVAASVDDGILKVLRISEGHLSLLATSSEFDAWSHVRCIRFDNTVLFGNSLFLSVVTEVPGPGGQGQTSIHRVDPDGAVATVQTIGGQDNSLALIFDFTDGAGGYVPGAYLEDGYAGEGTSFLHMSTSYQVSIMGQDFLPPGRTDLDVPGMEFDPTGVYGSHLTIVDCDQNHDAKSAIYQILPAQPEYTWTRLTELFDSGTRCYGDLSFSPDGSFGQVLFVTEGVTDTVMSVDPNGVHDVFATGFYGIRSITISDDGEHMSVSDANAVYRIRAVTTDVGPSLVMREPWVEADDVHTGPSGVDSLRLLWSERVLFENADFTVTNEDEEPVTFSVSGSNSQFMIIAFGEVLLHDRYAITISDTVVSAETGAAIDGDNDGLAGGEAILVIEHRNRLDHDHDNDVDLSDLAKLLSIYGTTFE